MTPHGDGGFLVPECWDVPINKWQRFKQKYFPYWLRRIFPIKTEKIPVADLLKDAIAKEVKNEINNI